MSAASTVFFASTALAGFATSVLGQTPAPLVAMSIMAAMGCLVMLSTGTRHGRR